MVRSPSGPAPTAPRPPVAWFPVTRTGKVALTLAYVTVLSPAWVFLVLGPAVFRAGASDDVVVTLLVATVVMLWATLLWAKDRSLLVAAFTVILSAALLYFLGWLATAAVGFPGLAGAH